MGTSHAYQTGAAGCCSYSLGVSLGGKRLLVTFKLIIGLLFTYAVLDAQCSNVIVVDFSTAAELRLSAT